MPSDIYLRPCHTFPGRLHGLFVCMDFPARRKSSAGKPIFCKFYFPSRMQGTCVSVASVLRSMRATPGLLRASCWCFAMTSACKYQQLTPAKFWACKSDLCAHLWANPGDILTGAWLSAGNCGQQKLSPVTCTQGLPGKVWQGFYTGISIHTYASRHVTIEWVDHCT